jgi:hypothetical protein
MKIQIDCTAKTIQYVPLTKAEVDARKIPTVEKVTEIDIPALVERIEKLEKRLLDAGIKELE